MQTQTPTIEHTIYRLAADMMAALPRGAAGDADRARIDRALDLVATVERTVSPSIYLVRSASEPDRAYRVQANLCNCPDAPRERGARHCKHAYAVQLFNQLERAEADAEQDECCIDCEDGGRESPEGMRRRCSNCPLTATWSDADRDRGFQRSTIYVDPEDSILDLWPTLDGEPCDVAPRPAVGTVTRLPLSAAAQALVDALFGGDDSAA